MNMRTRPKIALKQIAILRGREHFLRLFWGISRIAALSITLLLAACLIDWQIDHYRDTPFIIRLFLSGIQLCSLVVVLWFWLFRGWNKELSDSELGRYVESKLPELGHRLVTAIELTHQNAQTNGMSDELIEQVREESDQIIQRCRLTKFADHRKLKNSLLLWCWPICLFLATFLYLGRDSSLLTRLILRQFLQDVNIPHFIELSDTSKKVQPMGEESEVLYIATGRVKEDQLGSIRVFFKEGRGDEYPLKFKEWLSDGSALFSAKVNAGNLDFSHRAWLGDGRTKTAEEIHLEPRPVVNRLHAIVNMPEYVGMRPDGSPYSTFQAQGEVLGYLDSKVNLKIYVQKPIVKANLILISSTNRQQEEKDSKPIPLAYQGETVLGDGTVAYLAEGSFRISAKQLAYRIEVEDSFGFNNVAPPRRGINLAADDPPRVSLLAERFNDPSQPISEDSEVDGIPIPFSKSIRIAYAARSPLGLQRARLVYRVNEGPWNYFPLKKTIPSELTGKLDLMTGAFIRSGFQDQVEFATVPSSDPTTLPNDLEGAGRFDFKTRTLKKIGPNGKPLDLEVGDQLEFFIEVFDKNPTPGRLPGKSETRRKEIVSEEKFIEWILETLKNENRIRQLEEKQQGVFQKPME